MAQYFKMKAEHKGALLLFRVGDFYETFGEDAVLTSKVLGIVLTKRNNGGANIELAGFPFHSLDLYLPKLIQAGLRVAICEQLEKPSPTKKIVKRGVTEVISPGMHRNEKLLDNKKNNYLASIHIEKGVHTGLGLLDLSTGEFLCYEGPSDKIQNLLESFSPAEVIFPRSREESVVKLTGGGIPYNPQDDWVYTYDYSLEKILRKFQLGSLKGFGIDHMKSAQIACGAILHYLEQTFHKEIQHITKISRIEEEGYVWLDRFTIRNLELVQSLSPGAKSLLEIMDRTVSPMGGRLLKKWVLFPMTNIDLIQGRQEKVRMLTEDHLLRENLRDELKMVGDTERIASKIPGKKITPRQLIHLVKSLDSVDRILQLLPDENTTAFSSFSKGLNSCSKFKDLINSSLENEAPASIGKGPLIRQGKNEELDELRNLRKNSKDVLAQIQVEESEKTGIKNLKIGFNNVFGYYLEVTNKYKDQDLIPENWIRKQTLTNSERYITDELKKLEERILQAEDRIRTIEDKEWDQLLEECLESLEGLLQNARLLARLDCLLSFAELAVESMYSMPLIDDSHVLDIKDGRHPVIEATLESGKSYVPNDVYLDDENQQIIVITGPNMSGKSALLRQVALISLMAQMGSFVPARSARIGMLDRIFTRVGASDNISSGESTFMVEMNETASILNNLSNRSLILLDEIGRGTSTFDGISIAWSIGEYLHNREELRPKSLFATHYHELNELADKYPRIKNYHVSTKQIGQKVLFLRKLKEGGTSHSFGIHVARMAGMPSELLIRAREILHILEEQNAATPLSGKVKLQSLEQIQPRQLDFFGSQIPEHVEKAIARLKDSDLNTMTPIECMMLLKSLQELLEE